MVNHLGDPGRLHKGGESIIWISAHRPNSVTPFPHNLHKNRSANVTKTINFPPHFWIAKLFSRESKMIVGEELTLVCVAVQVTLKLIWSISIVSHWSPSYLLFQVATTISCLPSHRKKSVQPKESCHVVCVRTCVCGCMFVQNLIILWGNAQKLGETVMILHQGVCPLIFRTRLLNFKIQHC